MFRPEGGADYVLGIARRADGDQRVAWFGQGAELVDKNFFVGKIVADRGDDLHGSAERVDARHEFRVRAHQFAVVADQVIGNSRRAAVPAGVNHAALAVNPAQKGGSLAQVPIGLA